MSPRITSPVGMARVAAHRHALGMTLLTPAPLPDSPIRARRRTTRPTGGRPSTVPARLALHEPWDRLAAQVLFRASPSGAFPFGPLERGVNFFVAALESFGATTSFSCEGHPDFFYVSARMPHALARRIAGAGFLDVRIDATGGDDSWRLAFNLSPESDEAHRRRLRWTAAAWVNTFGLDVDALVAAVRADPSAPLNPAAFR